MTSTISEKFKRTRTFLKEWRKHRLLTQEQAAERFDLDQSTLSRIERGVTPYDQDFLEAAAYAYRCTPADLLMRNPLDKDSIWSIADNLRKAAPRDRARVVAVVETLLKEAG